MIRSPKKPIAALVGLSLALSSCIPYWWHPYQTGYTQPAYSSPPPPAPAYAYAYSDHIVRPARDREKRELARLLYELRFISENLLPQASYYANPDARIRFDWHQLGGTCVSSSLESSRIWRKVFLRLDRSRRSQAITGGRDGSATGAGNTE